MINGSNKLNIFVNGIVIDEKLPKFVHINEQMSENQKKFMEYEENNNIHIPVNLIESLKNESWKLSKTVDYEHMKDLDTKQLNVYVSKSLFEKVLSPYTNYTTDEIFPKIDRVDRKPFFTDLYQKLKKPFVKDIIEIDVFEFFRQVKGITKENVETYQNRLNGYIIALKNADEAGQEALKEKLLCNFVINKYESVLYANNIYNVVTEEQMVDFYKKTEKCVNLSYIKNYTNIIPDEVCKKIKEINDLEIFDNYVILHYDPDKKSYKQTAKEKEEEIRKRRDPILFGVIKGSNKLYYITDWIDEYCDLTLDKFVETIQIKKDRLKMKDNII